jgi:hypothetical protein
MWLGYVQHHEFARRLSSSTCFFTYTGGHCHGRGGGGLLIGITAQEGVWYFEKSFGVGCYKSA